MAGLWERWFDLDGTEIQSATILTTAANESMSEYHHRMPVFIPAANWDQWLDPATKGTDLPQEWLSSAPQDWLQATAVGSYVNSVRNQGPKCVEPDSPKDLRLL